MRRARKYARLSVREAMKRIAATYRSAAVVTRSGISKTMLFRILMVLFGFIRKMENGI